MPRERVLMETLSPEMHTTLVRFGNKYKAKKMLKIYISVSVLKCGTRLDL